MSHWRPVIGAFAVIVLLFVAPLIGLIALVVFLIAGIAMWVTESNDSSRRCPRCGEQVPNGVLDCGSCAFDFRTIGKPDR
jgi:Flp pilus assembly protein TadB